MTRTSDAGVVGVLQRGKVCHLGSASIRISPVREELVHRVDGVALDSIVGGEHNELRHVSLNLEFSG